MVQANFRLGVFCVNVCRAAPRTTKVWPLTVHLTRVKNPAQTPYISTYLLVSIVLISYNCYNYTMFKLYILLFVHLLSVSIGLITQCLNCTSCYLFIVLNMIAPSPAPTPPPLTSPPPPPTDPSPPFPPSIPPIPSEATRPSHFTSSSPPRAPIIRRTRGIGRVLIEDVHHAPRRVHRVPTIEPFEG